MTASLRIDTSEWISGALLIGNVGGGVLAENIASTGSDGPGYAYNDLSLPADNGKEICGRITSWPSAGVFFPYEDTSFTFTGAPDGSYPFSYQLYVDYVATGSPVTSYLNVGSLGRAQAESVAITDAATALKAALAAAAETVAASDSSSAVAAGAYLASRAETAAVASTQDAIRAALAAATESAAASDASSAVLGAPGAFIASLTETVAAGHVQDSSATQTAAIAETAAATDASTSSAAVTASRAETMAVSHASAATFNGQPPAVSAFWTYDVRSGRDLAFAAQSRDYAHEVH